MPSHHIPHCYTVQQSNLFGHVVRRFTAQLTRSVSAVSLRAFGGGGGGEGASHQGQLQHLPALRSRSYHSSLRRPAVRVAFPE